VGEEKFRALGKRSEEERDKKIKKREGRDSLGENHLPFAEKRKGGRVGRREDRRKGRGENVKGGNIPKKKKRTNFTQKGGEGSGREESNSSPGGGDILPQEEKNVH